MANEGGSPERRSGRSSATGWHSFILAIALAGGWPASAAPTKPLAFSAKKLMTEISTIEWRRVKAVNKTCQAESRARGLKGFGYTVEACAFWTQTLFGYRCIIYTSYWTSMDTLGHEIRHCFQGDFH